MLVTFNELRRMKDSLPDGSIHQIAEKLGVEDQTVRNYFGGSNYRSGQPQGVHKEQGPDGGLIELDDLTIYEMAQEILEKA